MFAHKSYLVSVSADDDDFEDGPKPETKSIEWKEGKDTRVIVGLDSDEEPTAKQQRVKSGKGSRVKDKDEDSVRNRKVCECPFIFPSFLERTVS